MNPPSLDEYAAARRELEQMHGHLLIPMPFGLLLARLRETTFPSPI